ncbi:hypothetical protein ACFSQT_17770 [Mesorhizobium calcicola]|uniref:Uncharacterized protein n=1 Tax=Mesorhizobium calcicola TaxID=1300310 RepID=A0ABW4WG57_9HYPH
MIAELMARMDALVARNEALVAKNAALLSEALSVAAATEASDEDHS